MSSRSGNQVDIQLLNSLPKTSSLSMHASSHLWKKFATGDRGLELLPVRKSILDQGHVSAPHRG